MDNKPVFSREFIEWDAAIADVAIASFSSRSIRAESNGSIPKFDYKF